MQQKPGRTMARPVRAKARPLILAMLLGLALPGAGHAFGFGHARLLSAPGQPLRVEVPITQLTADEQAALQVSLAPADAWSQAGLVPPVALGSLQVQLADGAVSGTRVARLVSSQPFEGAVADVLIDVRTASGQQRHQVSLLSQPRPPQVLAASAPASGASAGGLPAAAGVPADAITIRRGDTLFSIARKHAVPGVSLYQLMIALYQANPDAFINGNLNLIKAGATLRVPDSATLTAISDAEARRLFAQHARAFAGGRQRVAASAAPAPADTVPADRGQVSARQGGDAQAADAAPRDQLKLSGAAAGSAAAVDAQAAVQKGMQESQSRVTALEDNVRQLSAALQAQGGAEQAAVADGAASSQGAAGNTAAGQGAGAAAQPAAAQAQPAGSAALGGAAQGDAASAQGASGSNGAANAAGANASSTGNGSQVAPHGGAAGAGANGAAGATSPATAGSSAAAPAVASGAASSAPASQSGTGASQSSEGWFSGNALAFVTGFLALLVLIVAWLLRRANAKSDERENGGQVTGAMIQHKLDVIDLDLQRPASDTSDQRR